jgi:rRNA processing protein Krr1/Pno1
MNTFAITGTKENVEKAKQIIDNIQKSLDKVTEITVDIPHARHSLLVSGRGNIIRAISQECGGVLIRFPTANTRSDTVLIRGLAEDVEKAKELLLDLANDTNESNMMAEIRASPELHRFLIGKNGSHVRDLYERTGARAVFPSGSSSSNQDHDLILVIGKQDAVTKAKSELEARIAELSNVVEVELNIDPRYHRHFVARKGELLHQICEENGGVVVSFPRFGVKSDKVVLKGAAQCVETARQRILGIVADLDSQVSIECVIASRHHRTIMGYRGCNVQDISHQFNVNIKFPDRNNQDHPARDTVEDAGGSSSPALNGDDSNPVVAGGDADRIRRQDTIIITGKPDDCEAAKQALIALTPVTEELKVPVDYHRFIVGQKGRDVRRLMDDFDVNISVPSLDDSSDVLRITGAPTNVSHAKEAIRQRISDLDELNRQRALRNFKLELTVEPRFHPKIIGRRGTVVNKIRQDHDVQIIFPDKLSENPDIITIIGVEEKAQLARDDILKIVHELEDLVAENIHIDSRVHSRIIGSRGRGIHKIMDEFHVDIRFPGRDADDPNVVVITGTEDAVTECRDHLLNLEEEFLQDVTERESSRDYEDKQRPGTVSVSRSSDGYSVRGAPWSAQVPDTSSMDDFPDLASVGPAGAQGKDVKWGPRRC